MPDNSRKSSGIDPFISFEASEAVIARQTSSAGNISPCSRITFHPASYSQLCTFE